jgi:hypothetical protein
LHRTQRILVRLVRIATSRASHSFWRGIRHLLASSPSRATVFSFEDRIRCQLHRTMSARDVIHFVRLRGYPSTEKKDFRDDAEFDLPALGSRGPLTHVHSDTKSQFLLRPSFPRCSSRLPNCSEHHWL